MDIYFEISEIMLLKIQLTNYKYKLTEVAFIDSKWNTIYKTTLIKC